MKLLLGATIALLFGAVVLSWQGMKQGVRDTPPDELARLQKQINELRQEQDRLVREKEYRQLRDSAPAAAPTPAPAVADAEREALKAELAAKDAEIALIAEEKAKAERDAGTYRDEAGLIGQRDLEKNDGELRRARLIADSLLMGRVKEYAEDPQFGSFVTFEILMPDSVQPGVILAVRRKTGIIAQLKVSEVTAEGGIANMLPGFGNFKPEAGDELILQPQY